MVVGQQRAQRPCEVSAVDAGDEARVPQQLAPVDRGGGELRDPALGHRAHHGVGDGRPVRVLHFEHGRRRQHGAHALRGALHRDHQADRAPPPGGARARAAARPGLHHRQPLHRLQPARQPVDEARGGGGVELAHLARDEIADIGVVEAA